MGHLQASQKTLQHRSGFPQSCDVQAEAQQDPTEGGRNCDFCQWQSLTAEDTFGRWQNHLDGARSGPCCTSHVSELAAGQHILCELFDFFMKAVSIVKGSSDCMRLLPADYSLAGSLS